MALNRPRKASPAGVEDVASILRNAYKDFRHHNRSNPLEELVFIVLSLQTDEAKYRSAFSRLMRRFPSFDALGRASEAEILALIRDAGLGAQRARRLRLMFDEIIRRNGSLTLAPLRSLSDAECEQWLTTLPGVGRKTARCIMMYSFDRAVFPVDTHCWRVAGRLGWAPSERDYGLCTDREMEELQSSIPPHLRASLHMNLVSLGRSVCSARKPLCQQCPLAHLCERGRVKAQAA